VTVKPLLIFDFDGVIIDGLTEYWTSAQRAYLKILGKECNSNELILNVPKVFRTLRPWVKDGWEMVLLAAEIHKGKSTLNISGATAFSNNYSKSCAQALKAWGWAPEQLQEVLDQVRREVIRSNRDGWLASHKAFPFVVERIKQLESEGIEFGVLTTKSAEFTTELLDYLKLQPQLLYGHESGKKPDILLEISNKRPITGFIEDRRTTLETVLKTPALSSIPCYLASWGYLKPQDDKRLPSGMYLLEPKKIMAPLANWI